MNRLNLPGLASPRFERSLQSSTLPDFDSAIRLDSAFQSSRVPRHVVVREWDAAPRGTRRHCTPFSTCTFSQCGCALERSRAAARGRANDKLCTRICIFDTWLQRPGGNGPGTELRYDAAAGSVRSFSFLSLRIVFCLLVAIRAYATLLAHDFPGRSGSLVSVESKNPTITFETRSAVNKPRKPVGLSSANSSTKLLKLRRRISYVTAEQRLKSFVRSVDTVSTRVSLVALAANLVPINFRPRVSVPVNLAF